MKMKKILLVVVFFFLAMFLANFVKAVAQAQTQDPLQTEWQRLKELSQERITEAKELRLVERVQIVYEKLRQLWDSGCVKTSNGLNICKEVDWISLAIDYTLSVHDQDLLVFKASIYRQDKRINSENLLYEITVYKLGPWLKKLELTEKNIDAILKKWQMEKEIKKWKENFGLK